jgi:hypothetical protein
MKKIAAEVFNACAVVALFVWLVVPYAAGLAFGTWRLAFRVGTTHGFDGLAKKLTE